jgi:protocatechuate 3,4-dioxygenase beta subunit
MATVSTDARGRLRFRTRTPERSGSYELWARTANDAGGRPEHSCSMAFQIPYAG